MSNKKAIVLAVGAVVVLALAGIVFVLTSSQPVLRGQRVNNPDYYHLDVRQMTMVDTSVVPLTGGQEVKVDFDIEKGSCDLVIGIEGQQPLYRGNDLDEGSFVLTAPFTGPYTVTVEARGMAGSLTVDARSA